METRKSLKLAITLTLVGQLMLDIDFHICPGWPPSNVWGESRFSPDYYPSLYFYYN